MVDQISVVCRESKYAIFLEYQDIMLELDTRDQYEDALEFARYFAKLVNLEVQFFQQADPGRSS